MTKRTETPHICIYCKQAFPLSEMPAHKEYCLDVLRGLKKNKPTKAVNGAYTPLSLAMKAPSSAFTVVKSFCSF